MAGGMTEVAKATVTIVPNMKGSQQTIAQSLGASSTSAGKTAGKSLGTSLLGAMGKFVTVAAVGKVIGNALGEGAKLEQSFGGLETLYGDAAEYAKEYAKQAASAGISANDYAEQAVSFGASLKQAFGGDTEKAVEAANTAILDMADNAAKMGTPLESIQTAYQGFAKQNYTMLDNLKLGYGGTKEEMQRLLSDATKLSGVEYNMDNLGDVYEAIHVIQEDLGLTGVAADEAATTFSGSFGAMKAASKNLMASITLGENIGPALHGLGETVKTFLIGNFLPMIGNIIKQIPTMIANLPAFIGEIIPGLISFAADLVVNLAQGIITNIPVFVASVGQMFQSLWDAFLNIDWASVGTTIVDLIKSAWDTLVSTAQTIWDTVVGLFTGDIEFPSLASMAYTAWSALTTLASTIWAGVVDWFTSTFTWPNITLAAQTVWNGLVTIAESIWNDVVAFFTSSVDFPSLTEAATTAWNGLVELAKNVWTSFKTWFTTTFSFPSLADAAYTAWSSLITLAQTIWDAIVNWFTSTFSFPSLDEIASAAWSTLSGIASGIWSGIKTVFGATDISFADVSETASTAWSTISTAATTVWDGIKTTFASFDIEWPNFGELASGALEGLKTAAEGVWNWVKGLFSGDEDNEAVKSVEGSTSEMAAALADAELQVSSVDVSSIQEANEFVKSTVLGWVRMFDGIKFSLPNVGYTALVAAHQVISSWVSVYKKKMDFSWSLPTLHGRLPVISVTMNNASSSDGKTSVSYPTFNVGTRWFANGGIFNSPQIIGIGDSKGPEAAVPLDMMWRHMRQEFDEHLGNAPVINNYFDVDGSEDPEQWAITTARTLMREIRMA